MSDVAEAPTQVVETPVEVVEAPETVVETVPDTRTTPERIEAIRERGRGVRDEPTLAEAVNEREAVLNAADQKVDPESRKFVDGDTPLTETEQPVEEPVAEVPVEGAVEPTVTLPEGFIEIPLPEDHPLRARGLESLPFPADQEEYGRSIINQAVSKKEVELLRTQTAEAERHALTMEAETKFWRENVGEVFGAEFQQTYDDLKTTYGEEHADRYRQGQLAEAQMKVGEMRDQALAEARSARQEYHGREFNQLAIRDALHGLSGEPRYPGWQIDGSHGMNQALGFYGDELDAIERQTGVEQYPDSKRWHEIAEMHYRSHPAGLQASQTRDTELREELRKEVEGEATQKEKEALEKARTAQAANPLAGLPPVETGQATTPGDVPMTTPEKLAQIRARGRGIIP